MKRRQLLGLLPWLLVPSPAFAARAPGKQPAALLLPLSGPHAALGHSMQRAAALALPDLIALDTTGTPEGAAAAAAEAIRQGARLVLGPVFAAEVRPVVAVIAGRVPVLTFSNDPALRDSGAFLLGITPSQPISAVLQYARNRGVRRVAMLAGTSPWGRQSLAVALALQGQIGIEVRETAADPGLGFGAERPDALLVAEGGPDAAPTVRRAREAGIQLLGTVQSINYVPTALAMIDGMWLAAPDPAGFVDFARKYSARHGGTPGAIAALAYDGARLVEALRGSGKLDRTALLAAPSFAGVSGTIRFRSDGSCARELAILVAGAEGYRVAGHSMTT